MQIYRWARVIILSYADRLVRSAHGMLLCHFVGLATALDCSALGIEFLDKTLEISVVTRTHPVMTKLTAYINPCSPVRGHKLCEKNDNFCFVEMIEDLVTAVKPIGSVDHGSQEMISVFSENVDYSSHRPVPGRYTTSPAMEIFYNSAQWGNDTAEGAIHMYCTEEISQPELSIEEFNMPIVALRGPEYCSLRNIGSKEIQNNAGNEKGWRFFEWTILILLVSFAFLSYSFR